jgi:excisionase family DNA binding protein
MSEAMPLVPEPADAELARSALEVLDGVAATDGPVHLLVEEGADIVVPRSALSALTQVLAAFAHGEGVTVLPAQAELTTQQAADALNVSRPFLIGLLDEGRIAFRKVGTHRRVKASSLVEYMRADDAERHVAVDELSAETYDLGLT